MPPIQTTQKTICVPWLGQWSAVKPVIVCCQSRRQRWVRWGGCNLTTQPAASSQPLLSMPPVLLILLTREAGILFSRLTPLQPQYYGEIQHNISIIFHSIYVLNAVQWFLQHEQNYARYPSQNRNLSSIFSLPNNFTCQSAEVSEWRQAAASFQGAYENWNVQENKEDLSEANNNCDL